MVPLRTASLVALSALAACSDPEFPIDETEFKCDNENPCPDGWYCNGNGLPGVCAKIGQVGCAGQPVSRYWGFGASEEGWIFTAELHTSLGGALTWNDTAGMPVEGALELDVAGSAARSRLGWITAPGPHSDLTGRTVSVRLWTEQDGVEVKVYAQNEWLDWSNGPIALLAPERWTCVSFDVDRPSFADPGFDPTRAIVVGIQIDATAPVRLLVDDASY